MPPKKSTARGPRPRRAARPSAAAAAVSVTSGTASSSLRTELCEPAIPASSSGSSLETSSATIGQLQAPIEPSSHGDDERIESVSCERKLAEEDKFENVSNCSAADALHGSGVREVDKSLAEEAASSVGSALAAHAEENCQKTGGAEAQIQDSSRDGNNQDTKLLNGRENAGEVPRKRIVKKIVKVVRIVKRKVPKKVRKSDPEIECSNQETEANLISNHCNIEKEAEKTESISAVPMEVECSRKDEISGIEGGGSSKQSYKLIKDSGDKLLKVQSSADVLEKPLVLDSLVNKDGECGVNVCLGVEKVNELNKDSKAIEKEAEQAESIYAVPMEVDCSRKDEIYGIEGEGSSKQSDQDDSKLSKDSGDKLWKMRSCANFLETLVLDSLVDKNGECGVNVCLGVEKLNELNKGSTIMPDIEEPCTKILEEHDNDAVSFSSGGDKVKDLNDSMGKPETRVETCVSSDSVAENNDDSGGENAKDLNDSIDRPNTLESCTEVVETPVKLDSAVENYNHCGVDHVGSGGETVNEESKKCINLKEKGEGDDKGLVQSSELQTLEHRRRKTGVFVGGLDKDIEEEDIKKVFAEVGDVVGVRLLRHNNYTTGQNKGYAFVRYASAANAKKALEKYPTVEIRGKQCRTAPVEGNDTIYLGNINRTWMTQDVVKILQEVGIERIDKVNLMSDPNNTQRNRGYAFVELETPKDAQIAFKKFQKKDVVGKLQGMKVAWADPLDEPDEEDMLKVKCIYAEFIPPSWDEFRVRDCFTKFGEIETITLARNLRNSKRKDFAFINFKKRDDALSCVQSFKNVSQSEEDGSRVNICVSLARPLPKSSMKKKVSTPRENLKVVTTGSRAKPKEKHKNDEYPPKQGVNRNIVVNRNVAVNENIGMSSRTAEAVQFLRQQDALRHSQRPQLSPGYGPIPHSVSGIKRPYSALERNYVNSDPRGFSHPQIETSPIISSQRYNAFSQGIETVYPYHHQQRQRVGPSVSPGYNPHPNYPDRPQLQRDPSHYGVRNWHFRN